MSPMPVKFEWGWPVVTFGSMRCYVIGNDLTMLEDWQTHGFFPLTSIHASVVSIHTQIHGIYFHRQLCVQDVLFQQLLYCVVQLLDIASSPQVELIAVGCHLQISIMIRNPRFPSVNLNTVHDVFIFCLRSWFFL